MFLPISPPNASTSFTRWLFAGPPTEGLHDITPILSRVIVTTAVFMPNLAQASEASIPA